MIPKEIIEAEAEKYVSESKDAISDDQPRIDEVSCKDDFIAGATFAQDYLAGQSGRFAEWIIKNDYKTSVLYPYRWQRGTKDFGFTTEELFKLFLKQDK